MRKNSDYKSDIYFVTSPIATLFDHSVFKKLNLQLYKGCLCTTLAQKEAIEMDRMSNAADEKHEQRPELHRRPALSSTHGATVAAWKTSTPSTRYCQENISDKSQEGFQESHETYSFHNISMSSHCWLAADWQTMDSQEHRLT